VNQDTDSRSILRGIGDMGKARRQRVGCINFSEKGNGSYRWETAGNNDLYARGIDY
jgi:hypothetical protein